MVCRCLAVLWVVAALVGSARAADHSRFVSLVDRAFVCGVRASAPSDIDDADCHRRAVDAIDPQERTVWVRAKIDLPASVVADNDPLAIHIGALASSEVYWNGHLIGANGVPGETKESEKPGKLDAALFIPQKFLRIGENDLSLRMSSFHNVIAVRTPVHYLYAAEARPIASPLAFHYAPALLTAGAFVLAAAYFGFLSITDRNSQSAGLIAVMALFAAAQLGVESLRDFVAYDYPWHFWRLIAITLCALGFALTMTGYVVKRFQPAKWRAYFFAATALVLPAAIFAPGFDLKALFSVFIPTLVALFATARPALRNVKGARMTFSALALFLALILIDGRNFLDRSFYLAAALMTLALFIDQARAMRAVRSASEEMRARAARLELELLRRRIAPHFLMNTLNALVEWVESDPKTGVKMIEALAEEFRLLSDMSRKALAPLADELALCRRHLEVMSCRVDKAFSFAADDVDERLLVPPGVIHTLVENAFTHGRFADGAVFTLRQKNQNERVILTLDTPVSDERREAASGAGEGTTYVVQRLRAAFGEAAGFSDGPLEGGGWRSRLSFARPAL